MHFKVEVTLAPMKRADLQPNFVEKQRLSEILKVRTQVQAAFGHHDIALTPRL